MFKYDHSLPRTLPLKAINKKKKIYRIKGINFNLPHVTQSTQSYPGIIHLIYSVGLIYLIINFKNFNVLNDTTKKCVCFKFFDNLL